MFCPYPTSCIYDRFRLTGVHSCAMPTCQYSMTAKEMLSREIEMLARIKCKTQSQEKALKKLKEKYGEEFDKGDR